jgi:hypothetical protein
MAPNTAHRESSRRIRALALDSGIGCAEADLRLPLSIFVGHGANVLSRSDQNHRRAIV